MKKLLNYQLSTIYPSVLITMGIYVVLHLLSMFTLVISDGMTEIHVTGISMISIIFIFVLFVSVYGENLRFAIQNGRTRKVHFITTIITMIVTAAILSLVGQVVLTMFRSVFKGERIIAESVMSFMYGLDGGIFTNFALDFSLLIAAAAFGMFLAVWFARSGKYVRVMIAAGVPVFCFVIFPIVVGFVAVHVPNRVRAVTSFLTNIFGLESGQSYRGCLSFLVIGLLFCILAYFMNRKMDIK